MRIDEPESTRRSTSARRPARASIFSKLWTGALVLMVPATSLALASVSAWLIAPIWDCWRGSCSPRVASGPGLQAVGNRGSHHPPIPNPRWRRRRQLPSRKRRRTWRPNRPRRRRRRMRKRRTRPGPDAVAPFQGPFEGRSPLRTSQRAPGCVSDPESSSGSKGAARPLRVRPRAPRSEGRATPRRPRPEARDSISPPWRSARRRPRTKRPSRARRRALRKSPRGGGIARSPRPRRCNRPQPCRTALRRPRSGTTRAEPITRSRTHRPRFQRDRPRRTRLRRDRRRRKLPRRPPQRPGQRRGPRGCSGH